MECLICFEPTTAPYKIKCGSKVAHEICHSCETTLRLQTKPTHHGRIIKCPLCRKNENRSGNRTPASYEAELKMLYRELYPRILPFERPVVRTPRAPVLAPVLARVRAWCNNKHIQCPTKSKTTRKCTYPMGCNHKVCRHCKMCAYHFEF